jgi:ribose transport system substrate-binding protein
VTCATLSRPVGPAAGASLHKRWFGPANGYKGVANLIAKVKNQGIDFVYGMDDAILTAGMRALEEAGYKMGTQVIAVGRVRNGDKQLITEGKEYGTTLQVPLLEGQLAIKMVTEYLKTKKLERVLNFTPNAPITKAHVNTATLEGYDGKTYPVDELCSRAWGK